MEHLEERRTVLPANNLRASVLAQGTGRHLLGVLDTAIDRLRRDGNLIEVTVRRADLAFVTARARNPDETNAGRLALIGDRRQLRAVEAGQPFALLQDAGMPTARMDEVVRQRDADLRQAVLHMVADEPRLAVEELGNGVLETAGDELGRKAAQLWLDLDPDLRPGTAILAPTHELRAEINAAVRHGLEDEGVLHGPEFEIERYVNLHLTRSQKGDIVNYREGDVAVFHHDVYGVRAKAGDACRVTEVGDERVVLTLPGGKERTIDPSGYIRYRLDLFETRPMVLKAGDRVRWTRNDSARGLINGEHAEVLSIRRVNVTIRTADGREVVMARDDPQLHHLDHAYSSTVHAAQGITCDRAIAVLDTDRAPADQAMFYVELTRARDNVVLLTDDREALIEALETSPAEQMSALRAIGEQFEASTHTSVSDSPETGRPKRPAEKATVLDETTKENRRAAERFLDRALSAAAASIRQREEHATIAASNGTHVTQDSGYGEWRDGARRALDGCRRILDDPETYGRHFSRRPGTEDEMRRLSARIESTLASDKAEIERHRQELEASKAKERDIDMGLEL